MGSNFWHGLGVKKEKHVAGEKVPSYHSHTGTGPSHTQIHFEQNCTFDSMFQNSFLGSSIVFFYKNTSVI